MLRRRALLVALAALAPVGWLGCNAILGNDDARFVPLEGGAGEGSSGDTGANDALGNADADGGDLDAPITCDADLQNDPLHCGACTRDCFGGTCEAGACGAVLVATDPKFIRELAVDGTNVYWTNGGPEIRKRAIAASDGGLGDLVYAATPPLYFAGLAASGGRVYFGVAEVSDAGAVASCDTNACAGGPTDHAAVLAPTGVTVAGGRLFWGNGVFSGSVSTCTLPGCASPSTIALLEKFPSVLLVDQGEVLWSSSIGQSIHAAPITGGSGTSRSIVENGGSVNGVAASGDRVYYARLGTNISVAPRDGGTPTSFATAATQAHDVAADATHVYFADYQQGTLYRCPAAGCSSVTTLATIPAGSTVGVVLDGASVYWISQPTVGVSTVWRLAK